MIRWSFVDVGSFLDGITQGQDHMPLLLVERTL